MGPYSASAGAGTGACPYRCGAASVGAIDFDNSSSPKEPILPATPPAERLIGVTGHRILMELDKIEAGVAQALDRIEASAPGTRLVAVSSLAEGADRIVAHAVLARGGRLDAVLPLAQADYETDFAGEDSIAEFRRLLAADADPETLPEAPSRNTAYEAGGLRVLDRCEVLITVWDGGGALGQGGTAEIVARAQARGMPVAWVHAGNRHPQTNAPTTLGAAQGRLELLGDWPDPAAMPPASTPSASVGRGAGT